MLKVAKRSIAKVKVGAGDPSDQSRSKACLRISHKTHKHLSVVATLRGDSIGDVADELLRTHLPSLQSLISPE